MKMKNFLYILIIAVITMLGPVSAGFAALTVDATFTDENLNAALGGENGIIATRVAEEVEKYSDVPKLARGFGNANNYASHASTLRGYQGYDLFAISAGTMAGVQAPSDDPEFYTNIQDEMEGGDIYAGVAVTPFVLQMGINLGFILDGLYVSFLYGKLKSDIDSAGFKFEHNANIIGANISYSIFSEKSILARSLLWRGIAVQAGFIHTDNKFKFYYEMDKIDGSADVTGSPSATVEYEIDPSVNFELAVNSNIIPVELYTSIRILYIFNIGVGGGFDYVFSGETNFSLSSAGEAKITGDGGVSSGYVGEKGKITIDADTSGIKPDKYRPKLMANAGLSMGPVFIDIPATYYLDNGFAVGVSAGFVW